MRSTAPNARGGGEGCKPAAGILLAAPALAQPLPPPAALPAAAQPVAT
ncbi:hypothetical protein [Paracoccus sp. (in: a-proteobacteria)]